MRLLHFTSEPHIEYVLGLGELLTTESNIGAPDIPAHRSIGIAPLGHHVGPDVVWLTDLDDAHSAGITGGPGAKGAIKVMVDVPDVDLHRWPKWARSHRIDERWYEALARGHDPSHWWVVERNVPWSEWVSIERVLPTRRSERRHAGPEPAGLPWSPSDGVSVRYTEAEVRAQQITLLDDYGDGTFLVRDMTGTEFRTQL
jgi:hypothetical protein